MSTNENESSVLNIQHDEIESVTDQLKSDTIPQEDEKPLEKGDSNDEEKPKGVTGLLSFLLLIWNSKPSKNNAPHLPLWKIFWIFLKLGLNAW